MEEEKQLNFRERLGKVEEENPVALGLVGLGALAFINLGLMSMGEVGVRTAEVMDTLLGISALVWAWDKLKEI